MEKSYFDTLSQEVEHGLMGKNEGISFGFPKLDRYTTLRKSTLYLFGGFTGSGKTTCADEIFVLNPYDMLYQKGLADKFKITYWSMERKTSFKLARWFSRKCFLNEGVRIPMDRLLGWVKREARLTKDEHDLFLLYKDYFDQLETCVNIIDGRQNPTGIRKYIRDLMEGPVISTDNKGKEVRDKTRGLGVVHEVSKYHRYFEHNDPDILHLDIYDHVGKLRREAKMASEKDMIDTFSDDVSNYYRDFFGRSSVIVSQFNRSISNPLRLKQEDVTPMLEDFKSTSDMAEDADLVMSIFDPWRYKVNDPSGYELSKLRDEEGAKYYRNLQILKNSFGKEDVKMGLAYEPSMGIFREMPRLSFIKDSDYESITSGKYFLNDKTY